MNEPDQTFGNQSQNFDSYPFTKGEDANIDPLLSQCATAGLVPPNVSNAMDDQFLMSSAMWNPALNNPVGFYSPDMSDMAPATLVNGSKPPTETQSSPRTTPSDPMFEGSRTSSKSSVPPVTEDANTRPRRSTRGTKAQRQRSPPERFSNPQRPRRATKEPSIKQEEVEENDEEDDELDDGTKRSKFLKRNRIAASKCRQKKKEWVNNLEETRYSLEHENSALHKQYNGLVDELSNIKTQLMQHASCNDNNINQWLDTEAKKFVQRVAAQNQAPPGQQHLDTGNCCDRHRRNSSVSSRDVHTTIG